MRRPRNASKNVQDTSSVGLPSVEERANVSTPEAPDYDDIARRAYERFQTRGGEHGHDQEDWFEAEREHRTGRG